jgi:hypothetical protein
MAARLRSPRPSPLPRARSDDSPRGPLRRCDAVVLHLAGFRRGIADAGVMAGAGPASKMTRLSARELLAALQSVPPELPAGQVPVYVTDHEWVPFEVLPGCVPRVAGDGLLVLDAPVTVEQWEALSIEVHARQYPVAYVVGVQEGASAASAPSDVAPAGRRSRRPKAESIIASPSHDSIRLAPADDIPGRQHGWRRGVRRMKRT